ncbi:MAG: hypothetical protein Q8R00_03760 [Candidatus Nanoarchaeia archaeon]|nr:hypothetical protein [Candidatus Nanoarchaeia archaeon]
MQRLTFEKSEKHQLVSAIIVLAFVFSVKNITNFWDWIGSFILMFILTGFSLLIKIIAQKKVAIASGARASFELWRIQRLWFSQSKKINKKFISWMSNVWLIVPLLISLFSNGQVPFAAPGTIKVTESPAYRLGKKYSFTTEFEVAKIALMGPIANIFLALIIKTLFGISGIAGALVFINVAMAISNILPIPKLDGGQVYFGSLLLYIFGATFVFGCAALIYFLTFSSTLILSLIIALIVLSLFYYFRIFK